MMSVPWIVPTVEAQLDGSSWADLTADTIADDGLDLSYGIQGGGPLDNVAGIGTCGFSLRNRRPTGKYSPGHAESTGLTIGSAGRISLRPGIPLRSAEGDIIHSADGDVIYVGPTVKFRGTSVRVAPEPGLYLRKWVPVMLNDYMAPLAEAKLRNLVAQFDASEVDLLQAIQDALPEMSRPPLVSYDEAVDHYPVRPSGDGTHKGRAR